MADEEALAFFELRFFRGMTSVEFPLLLALLFRDVLSKRVVCDVFLTLIHCASKKVQRLLHLAA